VHSLFFAIFVIIVDVDGVVVLFFILTVSQTYLSWLSLFFKAEQESS
jgi:hypothetical protein